jgi:hypothetical protein
VKNNPTFNCLKTLNSFTPIEAVSAISCALSCRPFFKITSPEQMSLPNGLIFSFSDKGYIYAKINVPEFDNSAMDGYAIALKPEQISTPGILNFKITDRIQAGSTGSMLAPGCAARIFTGAPIPQGANTIIMQEV